MISILQDASCPSCKWLRVVIQPDGTEQTEIWTCKAFPIGIPDEIAIGENDHLKPYKGDNGIQYEPLQKVK